MVKVAGYGPVLRATTSFQGVLDGKVFTAHEGDLIDADHPAVKRWPNLFGPLIVVHRTPERIEQATARPGEKRGE